MIAPCGGSSAAPQYSRVGYPTSNARGEAADQVWRQYAELSKV